MMFRVIPQFCLSVSLMEMSSYQLRKDLVSGSPLPGLDATLDMVYENVIPLLVQSVVLFAIRLLIDYWSDIKLVTFCVFFLLSVYFINIALLQDRIIAIIIGSDGYGGLAPAAEHGQIAV